MDLYSVEAPTWAVKCLMHLIQTGDTEAQQDVVRQTTQRAKTAMIRTWLESNIVKRKSLD